MLSAGSGWQTTKLTAILSELLAADCFCAEVSVVGIGKREHSWDRSRSAGGRYPVIILSKNAGLTSSELVS